MFNAILYTVAFIGCYYQLFLETRYYRVRKSKYTYVAEMKPHFFAKWRVISEKQSTAEGALIRVRQHVIDYFSDDSRWFNQKVHILSTTYVKIGIFKNDR